MNQFFLRIKTFLHVPQSADQPCVFVLQSGNRKWKSKGLPARERKIIIIGPRVEVLSEEIYFYSNTPNSLQSFSHGKKLSKAKKVDLIKRNDMTLIILLQTSQTWFMCAQITSIFVRFHFFEQRMKKIGIKYTFALPEKFKRHVFYINKTASSQIQLSLVYIN